jgi:oxygen-independent coproporphyrinogen-3 oxidase
MTPTITTAERSQVKQVHAWLDKQMHERQINKVLHGFPSVRLWQEKNVPVRQFLTERRDRGEQKAGGLNLYVASPYCPKTDPERCGYCLFPIEVFTGMQQLDTYLTYLEREGDLYGDLFADDEISTIYFGGGTSNLYKAEHYPRLMGIVRKVFPKFREDAVITLEGLPQLFTRDKLKKIKECGVNRISMGAQQLNDDLNKLSGRPQTVKQVLQAIEWCQEMDLECNVDLIFGWPRQTVDRMTRELEQLLKTGIRHVTHYELNVGGQSDFALNHRHELPSEDENLLLYRASREMFESYGFRQLTVYDWEKPRPAAAEPLYQECIRGFDEFEMFGFGFAGVTEFPGTERHPGWAYMNAPSLKNYYGALDRGEFPIEYGFHFATEDRRLSGLFRNVQGMEADRNQYLAAYGVDMLEQYLPIWQALAEREWAAITDRSIRLIGDGVFYTPLIQTLLGSKRVEELKRSLISKTLPIHPSQSAPPLQRNTPSQRTPAR